MESRPLLRPGVGRPRVIGLDHFGGLLVLILLAVTLSPVLADSDVGGAISGILAGLVLVGSYIASGVPRRRAVAVGAIAIGAMAVSVIGTFVDPGATTPTWVAALISAMIATTPFAVLRRVLHHEEVTLATVAGSLCAYLLVGTAFSAVYLTIGTADADAFSAPMAGTSTYFSFVTLATLGYGDIVPRSDVARSLAMIEGVIGQLLLVTLVARFVSTLGQARTPERRLESSPLDEESGPGRS